MKFSPILLSFLWLSVSAQDAQQSGLTILTQQGLVAGSQVLPSVRQFLGIPFATAKRWQAPQTAAIRPGIFQATKFGDSCIQELSPPNLEFLNLAMAGGINVSSSEDCMSVNIWAPSPTRKQKTAVMVWIYGGGFVFGTSNIPTYNGTNFVRDNDDLTIVTFNYRLNIFGQPNAPQLGKDNVNFGLLDVDAAVQWVHANIANFGGDPNRIVLFGQSAGAAAVDAYTFSHPQDPIVKGVIEESGSISGSTSTSLASTPDDHSAWDSVASAVGCGNATTPQQFVCMQGVAAQTLEDAVISTNADFSPVIDNVTIFADTPTRAANGNFLRVPLLGGTVANEEDIFVVVQELLTTGTTIPVATELISDVETALDFTCPAGATAIHRINANVSTWRYQYQGKLFTTSLRAPSLPLTVHSTAVFPDISTRPDLRSYHASEIPMVFGTYNGSSIPATPTQIALSRYVQSAWVAFARNPAQGLLDFGWPMYNPSTLSLAQLGNFFNQTGVVFTQGNLIDFVCNDQAALVSIQNQLLAILGG